MSYSVLSAGGNFPNASPPTFVEENWVPAQQVETIVVAGPATFISPINIYTTVESISSDSGSIVVNGGVGVGGNVNAQGYMAATIFSSTSDIRQKKDVEIIDNALGLLRDIDAVKYKFRHLDKKQKPDKRTHYGVIAQDLQEKGLGDMVSTDKNGILSVNYNDLVGLLLRSVQELDQKVTEIVEKMK